MDRSKPGFPVITNSQSLLKLMSIELVMPSNHLVLCCPLLLPPSIFPRIRVFTKESVLQIRWPKYWTFSFSISPSKEHSGLISFRMDWLDLLAVQGTARSPPTPQLKSTLQHSAFLMVQLLHAYMTTGKTIALTRWTSVSKVMSLLFNFLLCFHNKRLWKFIVSYRQEASKKPHCQLHKWERAPPSKADKGARVGWRAWTPPRSSSPLATLASIWNIALHSRATSKIKVLSSPLFQKNEILPLQRVPSSYKRKLQYLAKTIQRAPNRTQVKTHIPWTHPSSSGIFCSPQNTPLSTLYLPPVSPDSASMTQPTPLVMPPERWCWSPNPKMMVVSSGR